LFYFRATFSSSPKGVSPVDNGESLETLMQQFTGNFMQNTSKNSNFCTILDSNVLYAFFRITTGDALSVRTKFAFLTWIGEKCGPLAKARAGPNKRVIQQVITVRTYF